MTPHVITLSLELLVTSHRLSVGGTNKANFSFLQSAGIDTQPPVLVQTSAMNDIPVQRKLRPSVKSISIFPDDRKSMQHPLDQANDGESA